jgi:chitodextrinase
VSFGSPDTEEPTSPNNLTVTDVTDNSVVLAWDPSEDDIGVAGYWVFRNGSLLETTTSTGCKDTDVGSCTEYSYVVKAYDYARNESEPSDACSVTTTGAHQHPDLNYDGITDLADLAGVVPHWLETGGRGCPQGDFNYDGLVNLRDYSEFAQKWLTDSWETVAYWSFDEGAGTEVHDEIGGYDGIFRGGSPRWVSGWSGYALDLDGVDDHVEIPHFELNDNTVTFLAWIRGWMAGNWAGIVFYRGMPANVIACGMHFGANNTLHYTWNNNSEATWGWSGGPVIPYNDWAMVALVIEPDKATAYVGSEARGLEYRTNNMPHISQTLPALTIGWDVYASGRRFRGIIDEVRIFDRALGWEEIANNYDLP